MNDSLDLHQQLDEAPWLGATTAAKGSLIMASAATLLVVALTIVADVPPILQADLTCMVVIAGGVSLGGYGYASARRGFSLLAPTLWSAVLDVRDGWEVLVARLLGGAGYCLAGFGNLPNFLAFVTIHDLRALRVESLAAVIRMTDVRDLAMLVQVHNDVLDGLEKLVRSRLLALSALRGLRRACNAQAPTWSEYRNARDRMTSVLRHLAHHGELPELENAIPR